MIVNTKRPSPQVQVKRTPEEYAAKVGMPPKTFDENMAFRERVIEYGGNYPPWAKAFVLRGAADPIWWTDTWGWVQNPKDYPEDPHRPLILFPGQQESYVRKLDQLVRFGGKLCVVKSREQLATVATIHFCGWRLFNVRGSNMKVGSYKAELVDGDSYADTIFEKLDYTVERMMERAPWALPPGYSVKDPGPTRKHMFYINPVTKDVLKGEAMNQNFGISGRYALVWPDEAATIEKLARVQTRVSGATRAQLYTSTPNGWEEFARMVHSGEYEIFKLHWTGNELWHPKGFPAAQCDWVNRVWPEKWVCRKGSCPIHPLGGMPHSEKYDIECSGFGKDKKKIAQELDMDFHRSGGGIFPSESIEAARVLVAGADLKFTRIAFGWSRPEKLEWRAMGAHPEEWFAATQEWELTKRFTPDGEIEIWKEPDPCCLYACGGDTARGLAHGDFDCFPMCNLTTGEIVAQIYGKYGPSKSGPLVGQFCRYYGRDSGCAQHAFYSGEWNGDGKTVAETVFAMGVPIFFSKQGEDTRRGKGYRHPGVVIAPTTKRRYLDKYLIPLLYPDPETTLPWGIVDPFPVYDEYKTFVEYTPANGKGVNAERTAVGGMIGCQDDQVTSRLALAIGATMTFGGIKGIDPRDYADHPSALQWSRAAQKVLDDARREEVARRTALGLPPAPWQTPNEKEREAQTA